MMKRLLASRTAVIIAVILSTVLDVGTTRIVLADSLAHESNPLVRSKSWTYAITFTVIAHTIIVLIFLLLWKKRSKIYPSSGYPFTSFVGFCIRQYWFSLKRIMLGLKYAGLLSPLYAIIAHTMIGISTTSMILGGPSLKRLFMMTGLFDAAQAMSLVWVATVIFPLFLAHLPLFWWYHLDCGSSSVSNYNPGVKRLRSVARASLH